MTTSRARHSRALGGSLAKLLTAACLAFISIAAGATTAPNARASDHSLSATISTAQTKHSIRKALKARSRARRALRRCHILHPRHCGARRHALRHANRRLRRARARMAHFKARTSRNHSHLRELIAPTITVNGEALSWNKVGWVNEYVLVRKVPGESDQYSLVHGTSVTPSPTPGATAHFSVRTNVTGSAWAKEVSISYPATTPSEPSPPAGTEPEGTASEQESTGTSGTGSEGEGTSNSGGSTESTESTNEAPSAFGPFIKGVDTNIQGWGVEAMPQIAGEMGSLGVKWAREDLAWSEVEPSKGVFDWSSFDRVVAAAKANGITILPVVGYAPSWTSPTDASAYAAFVRAAVERYGPGTSANLQWWELWNEPYFAYAWSGHTPEPEAYARDVLAAARAAKSVAQTVKLLIAADYQDSPQTGGSTPWETSWISDMFAAVPSLGSWINGVSVHPYGDDPSQPLSQTGGWVDSSGQWSFQRIDTIREKFLEHGVNVPFWITEEGWSTWEVSESEQARYYSDLMPQVAARPWIRALFPYCLREFSSKPTNNQSQFGLLKYGTWQAKPAFYALQSGLKTL